MREDVQIARLPLSGKLLLRGRPEDAAFRGGVEEALGVPLPLTPNTAFLGPVQRVWLQPTAWLVVAEPARTEALAERLGGALAGSSGAVVDVSDSRETFAVAGPGARRLLARGCSLDLHPRAFGVGQAAQCLFAHLAVLIVPVDEAPTFHLHVARPLSAHLDRWLAESRFGV